MTDKTNKPTRKYKPATNPKNAGAHNIEHLPLPKSDSPSLVEKTMGIYLNLPVKGVPRSKWTEDDLRREIEAFFNYVSEKGVKPTKTALALWLDMDNSTYNLWASDPKQGWKCVLLNRANQLMEVFLQGSLDKHTLGSMFLLKCSHGYVESSRLDVTTAGKSLTPDADSISEAIEKLGLDK